jgi:hypothetical protein
MTVHLDTSALVNVLTGPRRSLDALIALSDGAALWTLNRRDFDDIQNLKLV